MYSEILDDESEDKVVQTKFVWKPRVVLAILWVVVIWRFVEYPYFNFRFIWSILGLSIATYYVVIKSSISIYAIFILLGLGIFGIINHFVSIFTFSIGSLSLNLNYLGLLILHATLNSSEWLEVLRTLLRTKSRKGASKEVPISENRFVKKFETKTITELTEICQSPQYSKQAIEAANFLLKQKIDN